jgi:hypothetical protein
VKPTAEDVERARRWSEHIRDGAWTGDWEDRAAAARCLAYLLEVEPLLRAVTDSVDARAEMAARAALAAFEKAHP